MKKSKNNYRATIENIPVFCAFDEIKATAELKPHPRNPNQHPDKQINLLAHIIRTQGWRAPITISNLTGFIVRGHGRLAAANKLNLKSVPVEFQNYESKEAEWADLLADNKIAELANISAKKAAGIIEKLNAAEFDLTLTGMQPDELIEILKGERVAREVKVNTYDAKTKPGDLYELGEHKLLCGDATNKADISRLMGTEKAQLIFTDPPYGVEYESEIHGKVKGDKLKDNELINLLLAPAFKNAAQNAKNNAAFFIWYAHTHSSKFFYCIKAAGLESRQVLIWIKQNFVQGRNDYHYNYEPCIYAQKVGERAKYNGKRDQVTTWEIKPGGDDAAAVAIADGLRVSQGTSTSELFIKAEGPKGKKLRVFQLAKGQALNIYANDEHTNTWRVKYDDQKEVIHPTQKPVELCSRPIKNHTEPGDIVLDVFAGSGGLLIAAERLERRARVNEIDPKRCDGIVNRYINEVLKENKNPKIKVIKADGTTKTIDINQINKAAK